MRPHMLVQYPLVMLAGALLFHLVPLGLRQRLGDWNAMGISGLAMFLGTMTVLMIPRVLDLAVADGTTDALKFGALLSAGALLPSSWRLAGRVLQAFFLGTVLPMLVVVGVVLQDSTRRLCSAYRLDEQQRLGEALVWISIAVTLVWLWRTGRELMASDVEAPARRDSQRAKQ